MTRLDAADEPRGYRVAAGLSAQRDREVAFAGAHRPVEDEVLVPFDEVEAFEFGASPVGWHSWVGPVVAVELLVRGEGGGFHEPGTPGLVS